MYITKLTGGVDGVCSKVKGEVCEAVVSGDSGVRMPWL